MQEVVELFKAHQWFALAVAVAPLLVELIKRNIGNITGFLPKVLRWLPNALVLFLVSFGEAAAAGDGWEASLLSALFLTAIGTPAGVGVYQDFVKPLLKPIPPKDTKPPSSRSAAALLCAALAVGGPVGCAAVPAASVVANLPAIFAALGTAEAAVNTFEAWSERFKGAPGVTPELLEQIHGLSQECRESFAKSRELARKGAEFEEQAKAALNQGLDAFEALKATLASAGLFGEGRLLAPAATRSLEHPDELVVPLPPRRL